MKDPRVKKMVSLLELTESPYLPCFKTLFKNVVAGTISVYRNYVKRKSLA